MQKVRRHRASSSRHALAFMLVVASAVPVRAQTAAPAATPPAAGDAGLADIVVTANRREQNGQRVPIAITAFSAQRLRDQGITSTQDLLGKVPSVIVGPNATQRSAEAIAIRGQGQTALAAPGVVKYFDEVPLITGLTIGNQGGPGSLFDIDSVQVLRGPQGTLFGRNTTGGAFLIGPRKPVDRWEGYASAQFGNYNDREFEAVVNAPLVRDHLFIRLGFNRVDRDGFTKDVGVGDLTLSLPFQSAAFGPVFLPGQTLPGNGPNTGKLGLPGVNDARAGYAGKDYDDRHYSNARIGIVWRPASGIENYLQGFYTRAHDNGTGQVITAVRTTGTSVGNLAANAFNGAGAFNSASTGVLAAILARQQALGPRRISLNNDQFERLTVWGLIDTFSAELSPSITLRNIVSYQRMKQDYSWDLDGSALPILAQTPGQILAPRAGLVAPAGFPAGEYVTGSPTLFTNIGQITEEPQLQGKLLDDKLTFVVGGFYSYVRPEGPQSEGSFNTGTYGDLAFNVRTRSKAVYAQGTIDLSTLSPAVDGLKLTAGLRKTWDDINGSRYAPSYYNLPYAQEKLNSSALTWTAGLDYQLSRSFLLYGKVSRGYKSGGFNFLAVREDAIIFQPEHVTSYEIGAKSDFHIGNMPVRINGDIFDLEYHNIQRAFGDSVGSANPSTGLDQGQIIYNVGGARVRGMELEGSIKPVPRLTLSGNYTHDWAKYTNYVLQVAYDPLARVKDSCDGPVALRPGTTTSVNLTCIPFSNVAKNQFSLNARYDLPLAGNSGTLALTGDYSWIGSRYQTPASTPADEPYGRLHAFGLVNASLEWNGVLGSRFDARLFVTNLANKTYRISSAPGLNNSLGYVDSIYGEPRMFGGSVRFRFGE